MSVLKRKCRMISLRLSNEEYETLRNLYSSHGSRSVSEFARTAMQRVINETAPPNTVEILLHDLDGRMGLLDQEVGRLSQLIEAQLVTKARSAEA